MARPRRSLARIGFLALLAVIAPLTEARAAEPAAPATARVVEPTAPAAAPTAEDQRALAALRNTPIPRKRWALLDPFFSGRESMLYGGPVSLREVDQVTPMHGLTLGYGQSVRQTRGPLWISLGRDYDVRLFSKWTMLFGLTSYSYQAGLRFGPIEFGAGAGLNVLGFDVSDGDWSLSGLSPRASAKAGLKTGNFRVSLLAYRQYHWRWLGRPGAYLTGFSLELAVEQAPRTRFAGHPVKLSK
jgi:hypothetical protein